ncbi:MAG: heme A synthase [Candidatus Dormibacteria bacterium]
MTPRPARAFRGLSVVTVAVTYLLIVWGGVVRVSGSGLGCGTRDDWPLCHGGLLPPLEQTALIEFTHRWLAAMSTALVLGLGVYAFARYRSLRPVRRAMAVVWALFVVQIVLGAITVKLKLPGYVIMVHLANALVLLAALVYVAVVANTSGTAHPLRARSSGRVGIIALAAAATYALVLSGALVVANGAGGACSAWPLCGNGFQLSAGQAATLNIGHRVVAGLVVLLVARALLVTRRSHPGRPGMRAATGLAGLLLVAQVGAGAALVELRLPPAARGVHLALASALWATVVLVALLSRTGEAARTENEVAPAGSLRRRTGAVA